MTIIWEPSPERIATTRLHDFMDYARTLTGRTLSTYDDTWLWSVTHMEEFWKCVWDFCDVRGEGNPTCVLENKSDLFNASFFPNMSLNFAQNLLSRTDDCPAIIFHGENGVRREWTWADLTDQVASLSQALRSMGVGKGDRVAAYMPNLAETVIAMLATTSIGAVWSSCSPDFGPQGVIDRFGQIEPKVLFTANGYTYNGKTFDCIGTALKVAEQVSSIKHVVVVPYTLSSPDLSALGAKAVLFTELIAQYAGANMAYELVAFNDPQFILFSSGTTGVPKCIVHRAGGVLLQHLKEHRLQCDVKSGDRVFYFTTCGWMMWNWLVSALASEATIVLFEGAPFYPDANRLFDIAQAERVTHFGTSAKFIDACAKAGVNLTSTHDLSALRTVLSTGSPLSPEGFDAVYQTWKGDVCLSSIAGGTDIVGCFVGGNPIGPVYRGECQKRHLGMDVQVFTSEGQAVVGEPGELVCCSPHPSMPWGFWNDPERERYRDAYFARFENVWHHGDLVRLTNHGGVVFYGRSDATLNPGGVRIGTAEIYRQVERLEEVLDAVVVGQNWDGDTRVVLFVKLRDGVDLNEELIRQIKSEIRTNTTPRHVPEVVLAVADVPRTKSGKTAEIAVRDVIHGRPVANQHALANPEALKLYQNRPELA